MRNPRSVAILAAFALSGCASSPGYRPSAVPVAPAFRETAKDTTPAPALPPMPPRPPSERGPDTAAAREVPTVPERTATGAVDVTSYWRALGDTTLDRLMGEALRSSPDVQVSLARVRGARAARTES